MEILWLGLMIVSAYRSYKSHRGMVVSAVDAVARVLFWVTVISAPFLLAGGADLSFLTMVVFGLLAVVLHWVSVKGIEYVDQRSRWQ